MISLKMKIFDFVQSCYTRKVVRILMKKSTESENVCFVVLFQELKISSQHNQPCDTKEVTYTKVHNIVSYRCIDKLSIQYVLSCIEYTDTIH